MRFYCNLRRAITLQDARSAKKKKKKQPPRQSLFSKEKQVTEGTEVPEEEPSHGYGFFFFKKVPPRPPEA